MDERFAFYFQKSLVICILIFYILLLLEYFVAFCMGKLRLFKTHRLDPEREKGLDLSSGISIIKPLMGTDPFLVENLESHFTLNHAHFELLFCFHDDQDPALPLVKSIMTRYPSVDCRIFIGRKHYDIVNPLVRNILPAYEEAKYDRVWISTARIKANTDILNDLLQASQPDNVALVHQIPYVATTASATQRSLGQTLVLYIEKIYFGCCVAKHFLTAEFFNLGAFCGMSYLIKKSALTKVGGFEAFGKYLAEDYLLEKSLRAKGFKSILSTVPAQQNMLTPSLVHYKDRLVRWTRLRLQLVPICTLILEPLSSAFSQALVVSLSLYALFSIHPALFIPLHLLVWFLFDVILLTIIEGKSLAISPIILLVCWVVRELLVYYILFEALLNPFIIRWGKSAYRVRCGGRTVIK